MTARQRAFEAKFENQLSTTQRYLHQLGDVKEALQLLARKEKPSEKPSGL